ncbi:hypothetical protein ACTG1W_06460 [Aeromonas dhakensis]|uniref:hypothetical protein n=1 Tax=Aeromonas dhakensis TaxID=196024 RepID=UPI003F79CA81
MVEHTVTGLLADPGDWRQMAAHWQRLGDAGLRYRLGRAGQLRASQLFTVKRYVEKVSELWSAALAGRWDNPELPLRAHGALARSAAAGQGGSGGGWGAAWQTQGGDRVG